LALLERVVLLAKSLETLPEQALFFGEGGKHDASETKHGFCNDVALDLIGAGVDHGLAEIEIGIGTVLTACGRADIRTALVTPSAERISARAHHGEFENVRLDIGTADLEHGCLRADLVGAVLLE